LTESAEDVVEGLGRMRQSRVGGLSEPPETNAPTAQTDASEMAGARDSVLALLGPTPVDVDELIRQAELTPPVVITILLELDLAGRLDRHPGNRVSLR